MERLKGAGRSDLRVSDPAARRAILDVLPAMIFLADADGAVVFMNRRLRDQCPPQRSGSHAGWDACIEPSDLADALAAWRAAVASETSCSREVRMPFEGGTHRWALLSAEPVRDDRGHVVEWFGTFTDIDKKHRLDEARQTFVSLVENSADFIGIATLAGSMFFVNEAGRKLLEIGAAENVETTNILDYFIPSDLPYVRDVVMPALKRDARWSGDFELRNFRTGAPVAVRFTLFYVFDKQTREPIAIATVSPDNRERAHGERRLRTLIESGAALSHSLDYEETLRNLADLVVRSVATFCVIDLFHPEDDETPPIERITVAHASRDKRETVEALLDFVPDLSAVAHPVVQAYFEGTSSLFSQTTDDWVGTVASSGEHAAVVRALGTRSLLTVPLVASGDILGALTCGLGDEPLASVSRPDAYAAEDLFFMEELGRRAGAAIENARRYERERRIAVSLQEASLPRRLPQIDGLHLDADYRPGKAEATIGGDWYDAFTLEDGRVVLTIGDVLGKGLHAAIAMTKLRQAMQAAAMVDAEPNLMLDVADKTLRLHDPDGYATAIAAIFDPATHSTSFASAGHPGPLLKTAAGTIEEHGSPGLLLGLRGGGDRTIAVVPTPPGSALVFFTDGLIEATRDADEGQRRLHAALAQLDPGSTGNLARGLVDTVLDGRDATDDIAVLIAHIWPAGRRGLE